MEGIGMGIITYIIGTLILYVVIETAVRRGINSSVLGQRHGNKENAKPYTDLDND